MKRRTNAGFTLVEITIVAAIIAIVVAIAAPTWLRQREYSRGRSCQENLAKIDGAVEVYALEFRLSNGQPVNYPDDLIQPGGSSTGSGYLRGAPECPAGGTYSVSGVGDPPLCSIGTINVGYPPHVAP